ncbi:MAG: DnaB-like helicase C-terminal domain-containing protein [Clostridia bacterium]|nr:DnaB-like helicase C-terminal domain-containing protein [Clostridia bacterium]
MERKDAIEEINNRTPDVFLTKAKKRGWICPVCHNGDGKDGDGIVKNPKTGKYKCFKCNWGGDIIDLIGIRYNLSAFNDKLQKATEIYGISIESHNSGEKFPSDKKANADIVKKIADVSAQSDMTAYYQKCHNAVSQTSYFSDRGISKKIIDRFNLGYDAFFDNNGSLKHTMRAVILPTSAETFEARNVDVKDTGFRYFKHGSATLFNGSCLTEEKEKPVFIVEGIIDALSIIEAGGQAVGLGSAVNYKLLVEKLNTVLPSVPLVLLFDTDETGVKNENLLAEELKNKKIPYLQAKNILKEYHDPNDMLIHDADRLKQAVADIQQQVTELPDPKEIAKREYLKTSAGKSVTVFIESVKANINRPRLSTGFTHIDNALDGGIYTGLYVIGAISSLGKTTLALQIADNLAKQGRDVLFFSLEQSKFELMSKSISRETFLYCRNNGKSTNYAKSNLAVLDGRRWLDFCDTEKDIMHKAIMTYQDFARHIFIHEGIGNISVSEIREKVKAHISFTGNSRPIVFIDYLQILKADNGDERATDKQIVDHNVTALKQLSRDFDIPVIAVSSLNRQNYSEKINMTAFKESGAIEYGSDVLIGLQFTGAGDKNFDVNAAKEKDLRKIDFCILKNRNGKVNCNGIQMVFYPIFNCFMANDTNDEDDGFVTITVEQEDDLPFD